MQAKLNSRQTSNNQTSGIRRIGKQGGNFWVILCLVLFGSAGWLQAAQADAVPTGIYVYNDIYVYYDANHIPASNGTLTDISYGMPVAYTDDHVNDSYGNYLRLDWTNHQVFDINNQVVGFIYYNSP